MPFLVSKHTADWLRSAMGRGRGFGSRPRRIAYGCGGGGRDAAIPCRVSASNANDWADGVAVDLYANGFMADSTGTGTLYLTEVGTRTKPHQGMAVLAHRCSVLVIDGGGGDEPEATDEEES